MYCSGKESCEKVDYKYELKEKKNIKFSTVQDRHIFVFFYMDDIRYKIPMVFTVY